MNQLNYKRPVAIYVHGLASGAAATTFRSFKKQFTQFEWISDDFGERIGDNVRLLNKMVQEHHPALIIGTSLGGLTLIYANAPSAIKITINPALSIAQCVRHKIGIGVHPYFCPRKDGRKEFALTENMCKSYQRYINTHHPQYGLFNYAIFANHDELLGDDASRKAQCYLSARGFTTMVDPKGQHRIKSSTIKIIRRIIADHTTIFNNE